MIEKYFSKRHKEGLLKTVSKTNVFLTLFHALILCGVWLYQKLCTKLLVNLPPHGGTHPLLSLPLPFKNTYTIFSLWVLRLSSSSLPHFVKNNFLPKIIFRMLPAFSLPKQNLFNVCHTIDGDSPTAYTKRLITHE